jgi:hypothetical protein
MKRAVIARFLASVLTASFLAGCGGGGGDDNTMRGTAGDIPGLTPDLASIQANVFTPTCSGCHNGGAGAAAGMNLEAGASAASLINVTSLTYGQIRVIPGDPANSLIIKKLQGDPSVGQRMPAAGLFLSQGTINVISAWILAGAPP